MLAFTRGLVRRYLSSGILLALGFSLVIFSFITVALIGYGYMNAMSSNLSDVVSYHGARVGLAHTMRNAARERSMLLLEMSRTVDEFERDELYMSLRTQGEQFLKARDEILKTHPTTAENDVLNKQRLFSKVAGPLQYRVVELLNSGEAQAAYILLLEQAIPAQNRVLDSLDEFIELQQKLNDDMLSRASHGFEKTTSNMLILTVTGVLISITIAVYVLRRIRQMMYAQKKAEEALIENFHELELRVVERTADLKSANDKLKKLAEYDAITGLPNRVLFKEVFERMLSRAVRFRQVMVVFFLDLDGFKAINDTFGHEAGDALLKEVSLRIRDEIRNEDLLARIGGDEFALVQGDNVDTANIQKVAEKIISCLSEEFKVKGEKCHVGVSIGISIYPEDGDNMTNLLGHADEAMYRTKKSGKNNYCFYKEKNRELG